MDAIAEAREALRYFILTEERVRVGWSLSNGSHDKPAHVYPAAEAVFVLDTLETTCAAMGWTVTSVTLILMDEVYTH